MSQDLYSQWLDQKQSNLKAAIRGKAKADERLHTYHKLVNSLQKIHDEFEANRQNLEQDPNVTNLSAVQIQHTLRIDDVYTLLSKYQETTGLTAKKLNLPSLPPIITWFAKADATGYSFDALISLVDTDIASILDAKLTTRSFEAIRRDTAAGFFIDPKWRKALKKRDSIVRKETKALQDAIDSGDIGSEKGLRLARDSLNLKRRKRDEMWTRFRRRWVLVLLDLYSLQWGNLRPHWETDTDFKQRLESSTKRYGAVVANLEAVIEESKQKRIALASSETTHQRTAALLQTDLNVLRDRKPKPTEWPEVGKKGFTGKLNTKLQETDRDLSVFVPVKPDDASKSRCSVHSGELAPYQKLVKRITHPREAKLYPGLMLDWGPGSGKTRMMFHVASQWLQEAKRYGYIPEVLILLPNANLVSQFIARKRDMPATMQDLHFDPVGTTGTYVAKQGKSRLILHNYNTSLPPMWYKRWEKNSSAELIKAHEKKSRPYEEDDMYANLQASERKVLQTDFVASMAKVGKKRAAVPGGGLVIVDEAHLLAKPTSDHHEHNTAVLAWATCLRLAKCKRVLATATPLLADAQWMDAVRLLNVVRPNALVRPGVWRKTLTMTESKRSPTLVKARREAEKAETAYLQTNFGSSLVDLSENVLGCWSWVRLNHDPTVYPQMEPCEVCSLVYEDGVLYDDSSSGMAPGDGIIRVYVRADSSELEKYTQKLFTDIKKELRVGVRNREEAFVAAEGLPLTNAKLKTALGKTVTLFKSKVPALLQVLMQPENQGMKHWVYAGGKDLVDFGKPFVAAMAANQYQLMGLQVVFSMIFASVKQKSTDQSRKRDLVGDVVEEWYKNNSEKARYIFFGRSTTKAALDANDAKLVRAGVSPSVLRNVLLGLFNDARNVQGNYFRMFVGDVEAQAGIELLATRRVHMLHPPPTTGAQTQIVSRALRFCSMSQVGHDTQQWLVRAYVYVGTAPRTSLHLLTNECRQDGKNRRQLTSVPKRFLQAVRSAAVDCQFTKVYNSDGIELECADRPHDNGREVPNVLTDDENFLELRVGKHRRVRIDSRAHIHADDNHTSSSARAHIHTYDNHTSSSTRSFFTPCSPSDIVLAAVLHSRIKQLAGKWPGKQSYARDLSIVHSLTDFTKDHLRFAFLPHRELEAAISKKYVYASESPTDKVDIRSLASLLQPVDDAQDFSPYLDHVVQIVSTVNSQQVLYALMLFIVTVRCPTYTEDKSRYLNLHDQLVELQQGAYEIQQQREGFGLYLQNNSADKGPTDPDRQAQAMNRSIRSKSSNYIKNLFSGVGKRLATGVEKGKRFFLRAATS